MVGPTTSPEEEATFVRRLRAGFALLVGGSMALVAVFGDAGPVLLVGAFAAGTAVGAALAWWMVPDSVGVDRDR